MAHGQKFSNLQSGCGPLRTDFVDFGQGQTGSSQRMTSVSVKFLPPPCQMLCGPPGALMLAGREGPPFPWGSATCRPSLDALGPRTPSLACAGRPRAEGDKHARGAYS
jgi:hypothetical protein